jgi:hypothetical protein
MFFPDGFAPHPADIDIHLIPAKKGQPEHLHLDMRYLLVTAQPEQVSAAVGESDLFMWLDLDEIETIKNHVDPGLFRLLSKTRGIYHNLHSVQTKRSEHEQS